MNNSTNPFFNHDPNLCQAINERFNDALAYGKMHLTYIKSVILKGVQS